MKTYILSLGAIAFASTLVLAEGDANPEREGKKKDRPNPAEIFKRLDADGNGSISEAEFKAGPRAQKNPERATKVFARFDKDSNGEISRDEFAHRPHRKRGEGRPSGEGRPDRDGRDHDEAPGGVIE